MGKHLFRLAGFLFALSGLAHAGINGMAANPRPAAAGHPVTITVTADGNGTNYCGFELDYGNGHTEQVKIDSERGGFPRNFTYTYPDTGQYVVRTVPKKVTNHFPCPGEASTVIEVVATGAAAGNCPQRGWERVKRHRNGGFECAVTERKAPDFQCGPGFDYWEKGLRAGCRRSR